MFKSAVFIAVLFLSTGLYSQTNVDIKPNNNSLWFTSPATHWLEALPVGNGFVGGMVFGGVDTEQIQFNESSLMTGDGLYVGFYQPFGNIYLHSKNEHVTGYRRELSFDNAIHTVSFTAGNTNFKRECFVSYPDKAMIMMFTSSHAHGINTVVQLKDARNNKSIIEKNQISFNGQLENKLKYYAVLQLKTTGGKLIQTDSSIQVNGADTLFMYLTAGTNLKMSPTNDFLGNDPKANVESQLSKLSHYTYAQLKRRHTEDFGSLYKRVKLDLGPAPDKPSSERLAQYQKGSNDVALESVLFQYGRYLLISSSRIGGYPANLQGIWNNEFKPAWYSQYTTNINLEMNYWLAEQTNLSECHFPMFDWVENLANRNRGTQDSILKVDKGWVAFSTNNILGGSSRWRLHRPGSAWMSQHFWEHYQYTGDKKFLIQRAYPMLKELVAYWESHLVEGPNGRLITPDGWSPEHGPLKNEQDKKPYPGTSYDQQIVYDLFTNYIDAEKVLGKDKAYMNRAIELRAKLLGPQIGKWGQLQEWMDDVDDSTDHHRHSSHLFAVYPGKQISPSIDQKYADAASRALDARGNLSTGWSAAWRMNIRARLLEAEKAHDLIKVLLRPASIQLKYYEGSGVYPNFFDAHPPFQIDGNFGYTAGLTEMLLQSQFGTIHLLPAIPSNWKNGSVSGLKARGNVEVGMVWKDGKLVNAILKPYYTGTYSIRYNNQTIKLHMIANRKYSLDSHMIQL